jgi:sporulation protein YlmC with PRC-barrel domain
MPVTRYPGFLAALLLLSVLAPGLALAQTTATAPVSSGNPNLSVASVKMDGGIRVSKIIGSAVYADPNTQIGTIDDLVMTADNKVVLAVISVGGVLGVGGKLVAVPYPQLRFDGGKTTLPGVTKDSLNAMPNFTFNG